MLTGRLVAILFLLAATAGCAAPGLRGMAGVGPDGADSAPMAYGPGQPVPTNGVLVVRLDAEADPATVARHLSVHLASAEHPAPATQAAGSGPGAGGQGGDGAAMPGTITVRGTAVVFAPLEPWQANATYRVVLGNEVQALADAQAAAGLTFVTGPGPDHEPPSVIEAGATGRGGGFAVEFDEWLDPLTVDTASVAVEQAGAQVQGTLAVEGTTLRFSPATAWEGTAPVVVSVHDVSDVAGNRLASRFVWTFHPAVSTPGPEGEASPAVLRVSLVGGPMPGHPVLRIEFTEAMAPASVATHLAVTDEAGADVAGALTMDGAVATFTPVEALVSGAQYTVRIGAAATDLSGTPMGASHASTVMAAATVAVAAALDLGASSAFAVVATGGVSVDAATHIVGGVAVAQGAAFTVAGQAPSPSNVPALGDGGLPAALTTEPLVVTGAVHVGDGEAEAAIDAAAAAFAVAQQRAWGGPASRVVGTPLGPGVHRIDASTLGEHGVALDAHGDASASFLLVVDESLALTHDILLAGDAHASNVVWVLQGDLAIGAGVDAPGTWLAQGSIVLAEDAVVQGRAISLADRVQLSAGTVTLEDESSSYARPAMDGPTTPLQVAQFMAYLIQVSFIAAIVLAVVLADRK